MTAAPDSYCVMGNPVAHSRSPWIHARFAALTDQALQYDRCLVPLDGFAAALAGFAAAGGQGCNITVPFKLEAAQAATRHSPRVALAGAANTLARQSDGSWYADNTDGLGLVADITRNAGVALAGKDILLIGAGGAAAGVLGPLLEQSPRRIVVCNRTAAKAEALVVQHAELAARQNVVLQAQAQQALDGNFDVVINGTAASLQGAGVPVPATVLRPGSLAYDMMYGPAAAAFLDWAALHGATSRDGLGMLVEQAAESFALWRGVRPPSAQVLAELRALLATETGH
ncbi:shikimate dehydrogenase [Comamonas sp. UBA7528]|uniref:shikimate dehydrogenase n=1 Tax=Comamonas sp. UBA7528 TaxID=1946391 RepID=UPI0025C208DB|nr:shikimate dehydrogenase [Comamonas sp. UBA7528]